jgi:hypothetical protein
MVKTMCANRLLDRQMMQPVMGLMMIAMVELTKISWCRRHSAASAVAWVPVSSDVRRERL